MTLAGGIDYMSEALNRLFPPERVKRDADTLATWGRDWTRNFPVAPSAVVFPETIEEVQVQSHPQVASASASLLMREGENNLSRDSDMV